MHGKANSIRSLSKYGKGFWIDVNGNNNLVEIAEGCLLTNTIIRISGDNNRLFINKTARFMGPCIITMDGDSSKLLASGLLDTIYSNIYPIVIGKFYSAADLGQYTRAKQYAGMPSGTL